MLGSSTFTPVKMNVDARGEGRNSLVCYLCADAGEWRFAKEALAVDVRASNGRFFERRTQFPFFCEDAKRTTNTCKGGKKLPTK